MLACRAAAFVVPAVACSGCGLVLGIEDLSGAQGTKEGWSKRFGVSDRQEATQLGLGDGAALLVTGAFSDAIDFGGGALPNPGGARLFLASLDAASGAHRWSKSFGDAGVTPAANARIATDGTDVVVAGGFLGGMGFGVDVRTSTTPDVYVARLGPGGEQRWFQTYGGTLSQRAIDVAALPGDVVVAGDFQGSIDFGTGAITTPDADMFLTELNGMDATPAWLVAIGNTGVQGGLLTAANDETIAVVGSATDSFVLAGYTVPAGAYFLATFAHSGAPIWAKALGTTADHIADVALASDGSVIVAGNFAAQIDVGSGTPLATSGLSDVFVVKFDAGGTHVWSKQFGGALNDTCWGLDVDSGGAVSLTGEFTGSVDFGGGALTSEGDSDVFVALLSPGGAHVWSASFGSAGGQVGKAVLSDGAGNVFVAGQFEGTIDFGHGVLVSESAEDLFIAKLVPAAL